MKLPAPATLRQTFQLFSLYRSDRGLSSIADQLDWSCVTPGQIYHAVLGRLPENRLMAIPGSDYSARQHFIEALESSECRDAIIENVVDAFSEKRRLIFVHIPKCAGTDLEMNLGEKFPILSSEMISGSIPVSDRFWEDFSQIISRICLSGSVILTGHRTLKWYVDRGIYRFGDRIFSVIRDPQDLVLSLVNYIVMTLRSDPDVRRADTANWLAELGETGIPQHISFTGGVALARRVLRCKRIVQPNYLCSFLGEGTAESTLDLLARSDIEICTLKRYTAWKNRAWGVLEATHHNRSTPVLTKENMSTEDLEYLRALTQEDERLYRWIASLTDKSNSFSINGVALVRDEALL